MLVNENMIQFQLLINKTMDGTILNYPNINIGNQMTKALHIYVDCIKNKNMHPLKGFCNCISYKNESNGQLLRKPLLEYAVDNKYDVALGFLDLLHNYAIEKLGEKDLLDQKDTKQLTKYINNYLYVISRYTFDKNKYLNVISKHSPLNEIKEKIYENPNILGDLFINSLSGAEKDNKVLSNVINMYCNDMIKKKTNNSIEILHLFNSVNILTNVIEDGIVDSYEGSLLDGKITVATDRGYINKPSYPQQDAVFSMTKSDDCFLCIVADGAGGSFEGEFASRSIVNNLANWYKNVSVEDLKSLDINELAKLVDDKLVEVNNEIYNRYNGKSYSTFALVLCVGGDTLISNIGDSTIYTYDDTGDKLIEVHELDSYSNGMSYENARHNRFNHIITNALGLKHVDNARKDYFAHYKHFYNEGEKLIISSDGVTDLISEERFKNYFKHDVKASKIVSDAVYSPDRFKIVNQFGQLVDGKSEDNVSAIVIQLPNNYKKENKIK